ncbi:MAG: hypothetical protein ACI8UO_004534 [Verrucomicrobiales bacterium]|jgi:hypothetical protein
MIRIPFFALLFLFAAVASAEVPDVISFRNDVLPILSKMGCAEGSCHAKQGGQKGFQLTVFSYDPTKDYREIVHNAQGRRVFPAAPEQSLLLLKATQSVDHEGGERFAVGSEPYKLLHEWIRQGMPYAEPEEAALTGIDVSPADGQYKFGQTQQLLVMAKFSDGSTRDVTHLSHYQSNESGMATVDEHGLVQIGNTVGEGVLIVRFMEGVEVARLAVPPEKLLPEAAYANLPVNNKVDELVYARHRELGLLVSETCTDTEFIRRASLDAIGRLPTPERVRSFLDNKDPDKRAKYVDELLQDPAWADFWGVKWRDLIVGGIQHIGVKPVFLLDSWIRERLRANTPYDEFVTEILTAEGSTHEYGPIGVYRNKRTPDDLSAFVSQIFLGTRLDCAKCHHHPNEKWSQDDYFQMAAFFGSMKRKGQGISAPISGEAEIWWFQPGGEVKHPVTDLVMSPKPPDGPLVEIPEGEDPRQAFADWMLEPENPFFAKAAVNRVWGEFFNRGIVHPVDDFRESNPAVNEQLLEWLAADFVEHDFDLKQVMRRILNSNVYQASSLPNETNVADMMHFSRSQRRRMSAEVMLDAVSDVTGIRDRFQGMPPESRAILVWNNKLASTFLDTFGRPDASADCPCERDPLPTMTQTLHIMNSDKLQAKLDSDKGWIAQLAKSERAPEQIVEDLYLAIYARLPNAEEKTIAIGPFQGEDVDRKAAVGDVAWALMNSAEFFFNH